MALEFVSVSKITQPLYQGMKNCCYLETPENILAGSVENEGILEKSVSSGSTVGISVVSMGPP